MDRLRAYEIYVRVAEARSFSKAAESLGLGNATVSGAIRNLEAHLGVTLINRDTRHLSLTDEGLRLLPQAKALLEAAGQIEAEARGTAGRLAGPLRVQLPISVGHALVGPALAGFARQYPDIEVALVLANRPNHMIEQAIDLAVRMDYVEDEDLIARPLFQARYIAVCAPAMAVRLPAHPGALDARQCLGVMPEDRWRPIRWLLQRGEESVEIRPRGPLSLNTTDAVLRAARDGIGCALVLDVFARPTLAAGELVQVYPDWDTASRQFYLVTARSGGGSARVQAFSKFLLDLFKDHAAPPPGQGIPVRATRDLMLR